MASEDTHRNSQPAASIVKPQSALSNGSASSTPTAAAATKCSEPHSPQSVAKEHQYRHPLAHQSGSTAADSHAEGPTREVEHTSATSSHSDSKRMSTSSAPQSATADKSHTAAIDSRTGKHSTGSDSNVTPVSPTSLTGSPQIVLHSPASHAGYNGAAATVPQAFSTHMPASPNSSLRASPGSLHHLILAGGSSIPPSPSASLLLQSRSSACSAKQSPEAALATRRADAEALARRLETFRQEMFQIGLLQGFQHLRFTPRGEEELMVEISNDLQNATPLSSPASSGANLLKPLPRNEHSLLLSTRTQRRLSGFGYLNVGLPPASPAETEEIEPTPYTTLFLIGAYERYNCPYVWVRSNHDRLVRLTGMEQRAQDNPLKLRSTAEWASRDVHVWEVVAELVNICMMPPPLNPFALDFASLDRMPRVEKAMACGALMYQQRNMLNKPGLNSTIRERMKRDFSRLARAQLLTTIEMRASSSNDAAA